MEVHEDSRHIVVVRRGQFCKNSRLSSLTRLTRNLPDWFDCLDSKNRPLLSDREILNNLEAIVRDADKTPVLHVCPFMNSCHFKLTTW